MEIHELLMLCIKKRASDLHFTESEPPILRIDGKLTRTELPILNRDALKKMIYGILTDSQKEMFERDLELDFSLALPGLDRFRVNVHLQKGSVEAAFRRIPLEIPSIEQLGLPPIVLELGRKPNGLVLITGPTGVGKTTTLAAIIDMINNERECLMMTIEDPIEFIHTNKKAVIKQREVYSDTHSFADALRHCLRQDPNIIVVGEMRDLETISTALTAAETGHLIFSTLHTNNAAQTIDRIIDSFPHDAQNQARTQLAATLVGVVSQRLIPKVDGGRVPAVEIMFSNSAVRNLIREGKTHQLDMVIETPADEGMISLNKSLADLVHKGAISLESAELYSLNANELRALLDNK